MKILNPLTRAQERVDHALYSAMRTKAIGVGAMARRRGCLDDPELRELWADDLAEHRERHGSERALNLLVGLKLLAHQYRNLLRRDEEYWQREHSEGP